jgi:chromosomal replication initiator protein
MPLHVDHVWRKCQESLAYTLAPQTYKTWFEPITALSLNEDADSPVLSLQVPSRFFYEWLESRYTSALTTVVDKVVGRKTEISFQVGGKPLEETDDAMEADPADSQRSFFERLPSRAGELVATGGAPSLFRRHAASPYDSQLNPAYTFKSFIEGDCNRFARSASQAIAEQPGSTSFNPFLVYGGVGLGKTHVAHAVGNYAAANGWQGRCLYVSSERFTSQFVHAIQENRISDFTRFYRQIDLLIVDDIQFFGGKEKTQEEFFHIFNELHQSGRQIILLADRPPREIDGIEERLLSRFQWGLTADVKPPDLETRIAILQRKSESNHVTFSQDVLEFVAQRVKSNVRNLEGALVRLTAHAQLHRREIDCDFAADILKDLIEEKPRVVDIEYIKRVVAQYYNTDLDLLSDKTRRREIVQARQVAMYCCKQLTGQPLKTIGLRFGGRDHSTVIHACRTVENRLDVEPGFRHELERINSELASRRSA